MEEIKGGDLIRFRVTADGGFAGCQHHGVLELDRTEWEGMDEGQRDKALTEQAMEFLHEHCEVWWESEPMAEGEEA